MKEHPNIDFSQVYILVRLYEVNDDEDIVKDITYATNSQNRNDYPALVVELKWNKSAKSALQQIKDRKYPASIEQYTGDILLVGINYDKKTKKHECVIEQYEK